MSKYIVLGGAGFLGSNLCRKLLDDGHIVLCVDDLSTGSLDNIKELNEHKNFEFLKHDLTKSFFPDSADAIFNLASPASPVHYQYNPIRTLKMGTLAIYNILGMATRLKIPVLQASTSEVYGSPTEHPQKESYWGNVNPIGPRSCYDEGKRVAESLCKSYEIYNGTQVRIARIFNTYGPYMSSVDGRVISNFITQALKNEAITVYGDGKQTRSFCYVSDLVEGLIKLMHSDYSNPVNLGNPTELSILEIAEEIVKKTGSFSEIAFKDLPIDDPPKRRPDITLAKQILDWKPVVDLESGLEKTISFLKAKV